MTACHLLRARKDASGRTSRRNSRWRNPRALSPGTLKLEVPTIDESTAETGKDSSARYAEDVDRLPQPSFESSLGPWDALGFGAFGVGVFKAKRCKNGV